MKIALVNQSDVNGGAARAAYRIHKALLGIDQDSQMWVNDAHTDDETVRLPLNLGQRALSKLRKPVAGVLGYLANTSSTGLQSPALFPSFWPERLNDSDADIVNLHWINREMMSVRDLSRIRKPVVWTLHDMWPFCGAEHYTLEDRFRVGYRVDNQSAVATGLDFNRIVWERKKKNWQRRMHIISPSNWLADCARQSALMHDWPVRVVHNPIDTERWTPGDRGRSRQLMNLPADIPLMLFGAMGGAADPRKGFDLLRQALSILRNEMKGMELVVFGQGSPRYPPDLGFPTHYMGPISSNLSLQLLYRSADVLVIPSIQDNLPNTGLEALACGLPIVAFNICGLPDIVKHKETGYLSRAFEVEDLARGIQWVMTDTLRHNSLCKAARKDALKRFSYPVIAKQYLQAYSDALDGASG